LITEYENVNYNKFDQLKEKQLVTAVCEVCAKTMGALDSAKRQNLPIDGRLYGHPPLEEWIKNGFHLMII
ncbi:MAG: hypothetical protein ACFE8U_02265, partial [Candidatus Hermodarchaeota archaeon]